MAWPDEVSREERATPAGTDYVRFLGRPSGGDAMYAYAPVSVVEGGPARLVIAFHGTGGSHSTMEGANGIHTLNALLDAGYVVAAPNLMGNTWGNAEAQGYLSNLHAWASSIWAVTGTVLYGQSQGGGVAMAAVRQGTFPDLLGVALLAPAIGFQYIADEGGSSPAILAAYDAVDSASFAIAAADYDPLRGTPAEYAGLRIRAWASGSDTTTPRVENIDAFMALGLDDLTAYTQVVTVTGGHLSADHYRPADVLDLYTASFNPPPPAPEFDPGRLDGPGQVRIWNGTQWQYGQASMWDGATWSPVIPQLFKPV